MSPPGKRRGPATGPRREGSRHTTGHSDLTALAAPNEEAGQLTLEDALRARDEGARAAENSLFTGWRLWAEHELDRLAESGERFTADDLRAVVGAPPDGEHVNGIGGLFLRASQRGRIESLGFRTSQRPEARGRPLRVWVGTP